MWNSLVSVKSQKGKSKGRPAVKSAGVVSLVAVSLSVPGGGSGFGEWRPVQLSSEPFAWRVTSAGGILKISHSDIFGGLVELVGQYR